MRLKGRYLLLKASYGGGAVFWRGLLSSIKNDVDVVVVPLHKKSSMYLVPVTGVDKYMIPHYSILVAEVENPDFTEWCNNIRYGNECRTIRVVKKKKKVRDWIWEREIEYLEIHDSRCFEVYANAYDMRLATQAAKASETHRWSQ